MVGNWRLEEEGKVGKDGAHLLIIDLHSAEKFGKNEHVEHEGCGKKGVLAHVVGADGVDATHEDLRRVFIHSALGISNEWNVLDDDLVVNTFLSDGVQDVVTGHSVVENTSLGHFLGLEALVFLQVAAVIVTEMVIGDARCEADTTADEEVAHDSLEAGLTRLEIGTGEEGALVLGVLNDSWVEGVLGGTVQVGALLLDGSDAIEDGGGEGRVVLNTAH